MTEVMTRCVPVATGALTPDQRVNYQFGLVLGVDEFAQEDLYFRERDERAARTLHGYGTATGLHVTAGRPSDAPRDVEVRVAPGVALDQYGRPVVVRTAQCAHVGAWIAAQVDAAAAAGAPSPLETHRGPSGEVSLAVVAEYTTCDDGLVPVPGRPCGSEDEVTAPSRVRDSWALTLRWAPPAMPQWDGARALADLLAPVEVHERAAHESDEEALAAAVRALAPGAPAPATVLPPVPQLPRGEARAILDRLVTIWVTEVRPALRPDLITPAGEAAVLLSTLTLAPADPFDPRAPVIDAFAAPDDEGRPYLAPTQLVQELVGLGAGVTTVLAGSPLSPLEPPAPPAVAAPPLVSLATVVEVGTGAGRALELWWHLAPAIEVPPEVTVRREGTEARFATAAVGASSTRLTAPGGAPLADGERLEIVLDLAALTVRPPGAAPTALLDWLPPSGVDLLDRVGSEVVVRHVVATTPAPPAAPRTVPVREVVTATGGRLHDQALGVELWWHVDVFGFEDRVRVRPDPDDVVVLAETPDPSSTPERISFEFTEIQHNVHFLRLNEDEWASRGERSAYLRVAIRLSTLAIEGSDGGARTLTELAEEYGVTFTGAGDDGLLTVFARLR